MSFVDDASFAGRDLNGSQINLIHLRSLGREIRELRLRRKLTVSKLMQRIFETENPKDSIYKSLKDFTDGLSDNDVTGWFLKYVEKGDVSFTLLEYFLFNLQANYSDLLKIKDA